MGGFGGLAESPKEAKIVLKEKLDLTGRIALATCSMRGIGKAIRDAFEEYGAKEIQVNFLAPLRLFQNA